MRRRPAPKKWGFSVIKAGDKTCQMGKERQRNPRARLGALLGIAIGALIARPALAKDVQLSEDDEIERPDAAAVIGDSPSGAFIDRSGRRPDLGKKARKACSWRSPICVHSASETPAATVRAALRSAEQAWDAYTGPMDLPPPDPSLATGAYDLYLVNDVVGGALTVLDERDVRSRVDRANAFTLLDARLSAGCPQDAAVAYGVARAIQMRAAPATDEGSARAEAQSLASLVVPCAIGRLAGAARI
jgi:hypothetical protein